MGAFLRRQGVRHSVIVVVQADGLRFNRASLINAGFLHAMEGDDACDYLALHDVDLLPRNEDLPYSYPDKGPM